MTYSVKMMLSSSKISLYIGIILFLVFVPALNSCQEEDPDEIIDTCQNNFTIDITAPSEDEVLHSGSIVTIEWLNVPTSSDYDKTCNYSVNIDLYNDDYLIQNIASNVEYTNDGIFNWELDMHPDMGGYHIAITTSDQAISTRSKDFIIRSNIPPMPTARGQINLTVVNDKIYAIGGTDLESNTNYASVEMYDPITNTWTEKTPMNTPRWLATQTSTAIGNNIYAIGGFVSFYGDPLDNVEVYDAANDTWSVGTSMPTARSHFGMSVYENKIYTFGGISGYSGSTWTRADNVEVYDSDNDTWDVLDPLSSARIGAASATLNGKIYLAGGVGTSSNDALTLLEVYDPVSNTWEVKAPMNESRIDFQLLVYDDKLFAIGGGAALAETTVRTSVEYYDPSTNEWTLCNSLYQTRAGTSSCVLNDYVYIMGGSRPWYPFTNDGVNFIYKPYCY